MLVMMEMTLMTTGKCAKTQVQDLTGEIAHVDILDGATLIGANAGIPCFSDEKCMSQRLRNS